MDQHWNNCRRIKLKRINMMENQMNNNTLIPWISGLFSSIISYLFDIPTDMFLVVFFGTVLGSMFRPSVVYPPDKLEKVLVFLTTVGWLVVMTCVASYLIPDIMAHTNSTSKKGIGALTGFVLMVSKDKIVMWIDILIKTLFSLITGGKAG